MSGLGPAPCPLASCLSNKPEHVLHSFAAFRACASRAPDHGCHPPPAALSLQSTPPEGTHSGHTFRAHTQGTHSGHTFRARIQGTPPGHPFRAYRHASPAAPLQCCLCRCTAVVLPVPLHRCSAACATIWALNIPTRRMLHALQLLRHARAPGQT